MTETSTARRAARATRGTAENVDALRAHRAGVNARGQIGLALELDVDTSGRDDAPAGQLDLFG